MRTLLMVIVAMLFVLFSPLMTHETVQNHADQADVAFGLPLSWVHQDQRALDPPYPSQSRVGSLQEHPTEIYPFTFLFNVVIVALPLLMVLLLARRLLSRRSAG